MRVFANTLRETKTTANVLAELPGKHPENVVMVGAHLDSVAEGPGINDNGSGSAAILEVAEQMTKVKPWNTVRFAWWTAEESGLVGSTFYVDSLSAAELDRIALYLNFDMVGSPNFVRFVYDGSGDIGPTGPPGSAAIEDVFNGYFDANGLATEPTPFDGRSDYQAFINNGIPAGGLFTGAEDIKTAAEAAIYGGTAGIAFDPCYHQACDTFANSSDVVLDQMSDAIAHSTITFAQNTSLVNGVPGKGNFNTPDKINGQAVR
jgi:aminopeptidase Y